MLKRAEIVEKLINEGFSHETLSSFSDYEITTLGMKLITELRQSDIMMQQANLQRRSENCKDAYDGCLTEIQKAQKKLQSAGKSSGGGAVAESTEDYSSEDDGTKTIDTDKVGNPDVDIKKDDEDLKLITDKDETEEEITQEMVEVWMNNVVNNRKKGLTKSKLMGMVKNIQEDELLTFPSDPKDYDEGEYGSKKPRTKLFSSVEQEYAFEELNKYVLELDGYEIKVDELESGEDPEEDILNLFLESESGVVWDIIIYTDGNIYMDGAPIQDSQDLEEEIMEKESGGEGDDRPDNWRELPGYNPEYFYDEDSILGKEEELAETERDVVGAYMGAPVDTEMPVKTPVRTPTTTPTRPGRKRGPFTRPKTTPKPKAGKDKMPEWMGFDDIKSQTENS